ncbi:MAG: glycosyltransferase [Armatimonadetes bacterium]|nr:glycosyltransferase [Armatimonadota bacterium]
MRVLGLWGLTLGLGALLRLVAAVFFVGINDIHTADEQVISDIAEHLLRGAGFCLEDGLPTTLRAPLNPLFLSVLFRFFDQNWPTIHVVYVGLSLLTCPLTFLLAKQIAGARAGWAAAVLAAVHPYLILSSAYILDETLFTCFFLAGACSLLASEKTGGRAGLVLAMVTGVLLGAASLVKSAGLFYSFAFWGWMATFKKSRLPLLGIGLLAFLLTISPWTIRNRLITGSLIPIATNGGMSFWGGNNPVVLSDPSLAGSWISPSKLPKRPPPGLSEDRTDRLYYSWGFAFLRENIKEVPLFFARKLLCFWEWGFFTSPWNRFVSVLYGAVFLPLSLFGIWTLRKKRSLVFILLQILVFSGLAVLVIATDGSSGIRYRVPLEPFLCVLAGAALCSLVGRKPGRKAASPLRIMLVCYLDFARSSGAAVHTWELARHLAGNGHKVSLFAPPPSGALLFPACPGLEIVAVPRNGSSLWHYLVFLLRLFLALLSSGSRRKYDILYAREAILNPAPAVASKLLGLPHIVEVNGLAPDDPDLARLAWWKRRLITSFRQMDFLLTDRIVAVSPGLAGVISKSSGVSLEKIAVVPNGCNEELFCPGDTLQARTKLGLDPEKIYLSFTATLYPHEGGEILLSALSGVVARRKDIHLLVIGQGTCFEALRERARRLGIEPFVSFLGEIPYSKTTAYIQASDICLAPYTEERNAAIGLSPLKVYYYMACGRPVIATDIPGVGDLVKASEAGIAIPPGSPESLGEAVLLLADAPEQRREMGERGRRLVAEKYTWTLTARRIAEVCEEVLRQRNGEN